MKRTPLQRRTELKRTSAPKMRARIRPISKKRKSRVGKLGIVRLVGRDLEALRRACFERDGYRCQGVIRTSIPLWVPYRICNESVTWETGEMAHIRTKRNNGDTLSNVRTLCRECHRLEHNGGKKVCPKKNTTIHSSQTLTEELSVQSAEGQDSIGKAGTAKSATDSAIGTSR